MPAPKPAVSVIVPVHRAGAFLEALLKGLQQQTSRDFEVVLVGFKNKELASRRLPPHFFYAEAPSRWPDVKRNVGAKKAKADILAYIDEDCIPDIDWVSSILESFARHSNAAALEGATRGEQKKLLGHTIQNETGGWYPACNMAFREKDFLEINGFDEQYHFFREDLDIVFKLKAAQKMVLFEPTMRVFHPERPVSWRTFFNEIFLVKGDVRLYKKFPALYRERFGFLCRGSFKQAALLWLLAFLFFAGLFYSPAVSAIAFLLSVFFRYWAGMRKKQFSWIEGSQFFFAATLRDLLFPFAIFYYWLAIKPKEKTR